MDFDYFTKNAIATGGFEQLVKGQKELTVKSLEKKHAKELAAATPLQKAEIYERIRQEYEWQKNHKPSPHALW